MEEYIGRKGVGKHPNLDPMWQVYEAGATAILEALRENGSAVDPEVDANVIVGSGIPTVRIRNDMFVDVKGKLTFIPDDKE